MSQRERPNPTYTEAARQNALAGTPLEAMDVGSSVGYLQPLPPCMLRLSESQLEAWHKVRGKIQDVHLLILSCLTNNGPSCIRLVARELNIETSSISARMFDLKKLGLIEPVMNADGKQKRLHYEVRGQNSSGDAWQARADWKQFIQLVQGYPGILL
ncbi:MAG TPA: winged helix-turn-helix domain-containing protein [Candidatus Kapabacteria bacterium]|jgi:DNA-binding MarR family transcriptional regulator